MTSINQPVRVPPLWSPCLSSSQPVFIPARLCFGLVVVHLVLTFGGVIFLHRNFYKMDCPLDKGRGKQEISHKALARMTVKQQPTSTATGYLQWDINHSVCRDISYNDSWLTILQPGDYYIYSRVTFSKSNPPDLLVSRIKLKKHETGEDKVVMQAFCSLAGINSSAGIHDMCTATQGDVITLEKGNQLAVWVQDLSLVNYEYSATTFGMYQL